MKLKSISDCLKEFSDVFTRKSQHELKERKKISSRRRKTWKSDTHTSFNRCAPLKIEKSKIFHVVDISVYSSFSIGFTREIHDSMQLTKRSKGLFSTWF